MKVNINQIRNLVVWNCNGFSNIKVADFFWKYDCSDVYVFLEIKEAVFYFTEVQGYSCCGIKGFIIYMRTDRQKRVKR